MIVSFVNVRNCRILHTFPVATCFRRATKWSDDRSKLHIDAFELVFGAHVEASLVEESAIPGRCDCHSSPADVSKSCEFPSRLTYWKAELKSVSRTPRGESCMHSALNPSLGMEPTLPTHFWLSHPVPVVRLTFSVNVRPEMNA